MNTIKGLAIGIFAVWILGTGLARIIYAFDDRKECIDKEGWLKGLFWCDETPKTRYGVGAYSTELWIKGLSWPLLLFTETDHEVTKSVSMTKKLVSMATKEQTNSASCALIEMPAPQKTLLLKATDLFAKTKDSIALSKAFDIDEVPLYLTKCFQVHATVTLQNRNNERDFIHFYDLSERNMRMLLFVEVARSNGMNSAELKSLKNDIWNEFYRLNYEYY
ncbi:hypothetical protein A9Q74_13395 [Colwellia sp. 39_35_sub15_T18]|nr:hypothetical protein A9Q74_13395 [Colwellia sp. 39_35_sub15_T18]